MQTGILGIVIFTFAYLTSIIAQRMRESEQLATERSRELKSVIQMNEHIISNMRTGILVVNPDGVIEMANNAAISLLGHTHLDINASLMKILP